MKEIAKFSNQFEKVLDILEAHLNENKDMELKNVNEIYKMLTEDICEKVD